jgi:hypothetical protein
LQLKRRSLLDQALTRVGRIAIQLGGVARAMKPTPDSLTDNREPPPKPTGVEEARRIIEEYANDCDRSSTNFVVASIEPAGRWRVSSRWRELFFFSPNFLRGNET